MTIARNRRLRTAALVATALAGSLAHAADGCVTVEVRNVRVKQGQLMIAAYADAETFGKKAMVNLKAPAGEPTMRLELCGVRGSSLAITMFQDLDNDGTMARNLIGIPSEPWGTSGTSGPFGPSWETCQVRLDGSVIVISLRS